MIFYYALGGGLGHLTRARAVVHTLGLTEPIVLLTASPFAQDRRICGDAELIRIPPALASDISDCRAWLQARLESLSPTAIYLDAFPAGIRGEWCGMVFPPHVPVYHLARLLQWQTYRSYIGDNPPFLTRTFLLEPLDTAHLAYLQQHSHKLVPLELFDPPIDTTVSLPELRDLARPLWIIVHAGNDDEMAELLTFAEIKAACATAQPRILLISPYRPSWLPAHILHSSHYPAVTLFGMADRIISACGFNIMRQAAPYREKHWCVPFPRRFDDQFARAARRNAESW